MNGMYWTLLCRLLKYSVKHPGEGRRLPPLLRGQPEGREWSLMTHNLPPPTQQSQNNSAGSVLLSKFGSAGSNASPSPFGRWRGEEEEPEGS